MIPSEMHGSLPQESKTDLQSTGKCLAFELPTAAGFHVARATEAVIRWFMTAVGCPIPKDSQRNWGAYIKALKDQQADAKIIHHLEQIKDLHRNPLIHPEENLTMAEALLFWNACTTLMVAMIAEGERVKSTAATSAPNVP